MDRKDAVELPVQTPKVLTTPQQVPEEAEVLALILKQLYGEDHIQWQVVIDGYTFLAKVKNLLIQVIPNDSNLSEQGYQEINTKMRGKGFKVFTCRPEDLRFPRRLEREIRRLVR